MHHPITFLHVALGALLALGLSGPAQAQSCPARALRIAFIDRDAPPFLVGAGTEFAAGDPGLMVTEVRAALRRLGCKAELMRLPARRLQLELSASRVDFGVGLGDTPERLALWHFPLGADGRLDRRLAMGVSPVAWVTLSRRQPALQAAWQAGQLGGRLGAATASASAALAQRGGQAVEPVFEVAKLVQLLELERFDAIALPTATYAQLLQDAADRVALLQPPISIQHYYAPASPALFERHGALVRRFWSALCDEARKRRVAPACPRD